MEFSASYQEVFSALVHANRILGACKRWHAQGVCPRVPSSGWCFESQALVVQRLRDSFLSNTEIETHRPEFGQRHAALGEVHLLEILVLHRGTNRSGCTHECVQTRAPVPPWCRCRLSRGCLRMQEASGRPWRLARRLLPASPLCLGQATCGRVRPVGLARSDSCLTWMTAMVDALGSTSMPWASSSKRASTFTCSISIVTTSHLHPHDQASSRHGSCGQSEAVQWTGSPPLRNALRGFCTPVDREAITQRRRLQVLEMKGASEAWSGSWKERRKCSRAHKPDFCFEKNMESSPSFGAPMFLLDQHSGRWLSSLFCAEWFRT